MSNENEPEYLTASEAVKYLAARWGIESYSLVAFRALRFRYGIKPAIGSNTATFWRKSDLDAIPKPDRSKPRGPRKKLEIDEDSAGNPSVVLMAIGLRGGLARHSTRELVAVG